MKRHEKDTNLTIVCFALPVFSGMCYLSFSYLLIRGLLRSKNYVPPGCVLIHGNPWKWEHIQDFIEDCRGSKWEKKKWQKGPALRSKDGLSLTLYSGQQYDPDKFELIPKGWDHDHCYICTYTISDKVSEYGCSSGYTNGNIWLCTECYEKFVENSSI